MPFPYDKYPWLNFQELNLAYFIEHFREIFQQWDQLYHDLLDWKDATDADLAEWKTTVESGISSWETGFIQSMEDWKDETESDISAWEAATLAALDAWKTATTAVFEQIRTEAAASATAAAGSASDAQTALAGAQAAQAAAEAAAAQIQSELAQIQTNTANISELNAQISEIATNDFEKVDAKTFFEDVTPFLAYSAQPAGSAGSYSIQCNSSASYNTYSFIPSRDCKIYVDSSELITTYYSIIIGRNAAQNEWIENVETNKWNLACPSQAGRYRMSGEENTLPTVNNPLSLTTNDVVVITTRANANDTPLYVDGVWTLTNNVSLNEKQLDQAADYVKPLISEAGSFAIKAWKQSGGIVRDIDLYIPSLTEGKFLKYNIHKFTNANNNSNGWVVNGLWIVDANGNILLNICPSGEWEMAIKLKDISDFIGLRNHGNEQTTYNKFYVDGQEISESAVAEYTGKTFTMVQVTDMFIPGDPTTKCGTHYLEAIFDSKKIRFNQRIVWEWTGYTGQGDFIAMFPVQRINDNVQITDYAFDGNTFISYDVSTAGFTHYMHDYISRDSISIYGTTSGIFATVKILSDMPATHYAFVQNTDLYNKLYFSYVGPEEEITSGDVWEWKSEYEITYKDLT